MGGRACDDSGNLPELSLADDAAEPHAGRDSVLV